MAEYRVEWGAYVTAGTPLEAAQVALDLMRKNGLTVFNLERGEKKWQAVAGPGDLTIKEKE